MRILRSLKIVLAIACVAFPQLAFSENVSEKVERLDPHPRTTNQTPKKRAQSIIILKQPSVLQTLHATFGSKNEISRSSSTSVAKVADEASFSIASSQRTIQSLISKKGHAVLGTTSLAVNTMLVDGTVTKEEIEGDFPGLVQAVYENGEVKAHLAQSVPALGADQVWLRTAPGGGSVQGQALRIGIIDTGIDYTHPDVGGCARVANINAGSCVKVAGGYDFVSNDNDPFDDHGHGTHVAATAAGNGTLLGVAPQATLYAYKVLNESGSGDDFSIIKAIERSVDPNGDGNPQDHLDVINLSLGGPGDPNDPMALAVDNASAAGVVVVVSAGNEGPFGSTIGSPGCARSAITVGAETKAHRIADFSSRGPVYVQNGDHTLALQKPDILAPGVSICAAKANAKNDDSSRDCMDNRHWAISGTSMASPHIAGLSALLKQAHPDWSPLQIKTALRQTATVSTANMPEGIEDQGHGSANAVAAVDYSGFVGFPSDQVAIYPERLKITNSVAALPGYEIRISYATTSDIGQLNPASWQPLFSGTVAELIASTTQPSINSLPSERYALRTQLLLNNNVVFTDYNLVEFERYRFEGIASSEIIGKGPIPFKIATSVGFLPDQIAMQLRLDDGNLIDLPLTNTYESSLSIPGISPRRGLSISANIQHHGINETLSLIDLSMEPRIKPGFPIKIPAGECRNESCYGTEFVEPVAYDFDGDQKKEIVVFRPGGKQSDEILIIDHQGNIIRSLGVTGLAPVPNRTVLKTSRPSLLVSDLDGDGQAEIVLIGQYYLEGANEAFEQFVVVEVMDRFGKQRSGFPLTLKTGAWKLAPVLADMNRDGRKEIIIAILIADSIGTHIISADGQTMTKPAFEENADFLFGVEDRGGHPVIGNFDSDPDLEAAVFLQYYEVVNDKSREKSSVFVVNWDEDDTQPLKPLYTFYDGRMPGTAVSQDLNNDGIQEVVFPLSIYNSDQDIEYFEIHALTMDSKELLGFPIRTDNHPLGCQNKSSVTCGFYSASFSSVVWPGFLNRIVTGAAGSESGLASQQHTIYPGGFSPLVSGAPPFVFFTSEALNADVSGDGLPDLVVDAKDWAISPDRRGIYLFESESNFKNYGFLTAPKNFYRTPTDSSIVDDFDGDGKNDILTDGVLNQTTGFFMLYMYDTPGVATPGGWTRWRGDNERTSCGDCVMSPLVGFEEVPRIIEQPVSRSIPVGSSATLSVKAEGGTLTYQWQTLNKTANRWESIAGARSATLTVSPTIQGQLDYYRVVVRNNSHRVISSEVVIEAKEDQCPLDPTKGEPGQCGCGKPEVDSNANGQIDCAEIRSYKKLPKAKISKIKKKAGKFTVKLPVRDVTRYQISFENTTAPKARNGKVKAKKFSAKTATFTVKLAKGKYKVSYVLFPRGLAELKMAKGPASKYEVK